MAIAKAAKGAAAKKKALTFVVDCRCVLGLEEGERLVQRVCTQI